MNFQNYLLYNVVDFLTGVGSAQLSLVIWYFWCCLFSVMVFVLYVLVTLFSVFITLFYVLVTLLRVLIYLFCVNLYILC